jgi:catechol 2,3-dioxygenase-like lactoylglutathione lyase family enzyme
MLAEAPVHTTLPAQDLERAKRFYSEKLGLTPARELPGGAFYECGDGTRFLVYPAAGSASGEHTQIGFRVKDIRAEVDDLRSRGVEFLEYPNTENGIATTGPVMAAWLKDSEGNLIGVVQLPE